MKSPPVLHNNAAASTNTSGDTWLLRLLILIDRHRSERNVIGAWDTRRPNKKLAANFRG